MFIPRSSNKPGTINKKFLEVSIPHLERVTDKYSFISTQTFVDDVQSSGFALSKLQGNSPTGFGKHLLTFDRPDLTLPNGDKLQVLAFNSHDATSAFKLFLGYYRLVCSNGLMVGTCLKASRVVHVGYTIGKVNEAIDNCLGGIGELTKQVEEMQLKQLTPQAVYAFAVEAGILRSAYNPAELLTIRRKADEGNTLWSVFNRIQENLVSGEFKILDANANQRYARRLSGPKSLVEVNRKLWDIASKYLQAA